MGSRSVERGMRMLRLRVVRVLSAGALLAMVGSTTASAGSPPAAVGHARGGQAGPTTSPDHIAPILFNQLSEATQTGIVSQNFEASLDAYDNEGADDFEVPVGKTWEIQAVRAAGLYFNGPGPAASETVTFYDDAGGVPGNVVATFTGVGTDHNGIFTFTLSQSVTLGPGAYWVSVVANQDFTPYGEWGWRTRTKLRLSPAVWQNPADGFGTGCTTWMNMQRCVGIMGTPDFAFALAGIVT
jgi:hypothetical protein